MNKYEFEEEDERKVFFESLREIINNDSEMKCRFETMMYDVRNFTNEEIILMFILFPLINKI